MSENPVAGRRTPPRASADAPRPPASAVPGAAFDATPEDIHAAGLLALEALERHWQSISARPVVPSVTPRELDALFDEPLPEGPAPLADVVREAIAKLEPHVTALGHPRFFAFVNPGTNAASPPAELLAAAYNQNLGAWRNSPAGTHLEKRVMRWLAEIVGLPPGAGGILVSGGTMASQAALGAALRARAPWDVRRLGLQAGPGPLTVYASEEVHRCVVKSAGLLGLGEEHVRLTPVDRHFRADVRAMRDFLTRDRKAGAVPLAIIGSAGTVNSGAVDPLDALADLAAEEGLWFHVDGAYGGLAALAPSAQPLLAGMERADSIAIDPHKWLFVPYEAGACLLRDPELLRKAYGGAASYMREDKDALAAEGERTDLFEYGPQLSRGFRALKVWMSLKTYGRRAYADAIEEHCRLARLLDEKIRQHPNFELCSEAQLSISCFRWLPPGPRPDPDTLDRIQERLALALERSGEAFMSGTRLAGRSVLRTCILSFRTRESDLDALLESLDRLGHELSDTSRGTRP
ncbi:MAG: hypothetical protein HZB25_14245 [Candidatus Eisenbacteria bacterium]|nr:hypothetical protein [Candidatus Eisenbacteria bacterium]